MTADELQEDSDKTSLRISQSVSRLNIHRHTHEHTDGELCVGDVQHCAPFAHTTTKPDNAQRSNHITARSESCDLFRVFLRNRKPVERARNKSPSFSFCPEIQILFIKQENQI